MRLITVIATTLSLSACDHASGEFFNESNCPIELTSSFQSPHIPDGTSAIKLGPGKGSAVMDSPPTRFKEIKVKDAVGNERKYSSDDLAKRRLTDSNDDNWAYLNQDVVFLRERPPQGELDRIAKIGCTDLSSEK
jgi:hypothetical protein